MKTAATASRVYVDAADELDSLGALQLRPPKYLDPATTKFIHENMYEV
jgi:hypothetical protein